MDSFTVQAVTQNASMDFECMNGFWQVLLMALKRNKSEKNKNSEAISTTATSSYDKPAPDNLNSEASSAVQEKPKKLRKSLSFKKGLPRVRLIPTVDCDSGDCCNGINVYKDIAPEDKQLIRHYLEPTPARLARDREAAANKPLPLEAKYITQDILDPKDSETLLAALGNAARLRRNDLIKDFVKKTGEVSLLEYLLLE